MHHFLASILPLDWRSLWLIVAAFIGGTLNAVAGGGSFLTFPAMLGVGLLPIQANATNTVALWPGQLTSIAAYRGHIRNHLRLAFWMALAGFLGGTAGAIVLLSTPQRTFLHLVPWLLLVAALIFAASGPAARWLARRADARRTQMATGGVKRGISGLLFAATVVVCFYIGYFGAGAGIILLAVLALHAEEPLAVTNAVKNVATSTANVVAAVAYMFLSPIAWPQAIAIALGGLLGSWLGPQLVRVLPQRPLRYAIGAAGIGLAAYLLTG